MYKRQEQGDLALGVFQLAKERGAPPPVYAQHWAAAISAELGREGGTLGSLEIPVVSVGVAGPYVNLTLEAEGLARTTLGEVTGHGDRYGWRRLADEDVRELVMVEYSGPNTNKPLHLGHLRNNVLGMAITNLLEAGGAEVIRVNLVNDRGIHICKSMLAYDRWGTGETPESTGEKGDHLVGRYYVLFDQHLKAERTAFALERDYDPTRASRETLRALSDPEEVKRREAEAEAFEHDFEKQSKLLADARDYLLRWEAGDEATLSLWRRMNDWVYAGFRVTYARLGCRFDKWYFESEVWQRAKAEVQRGIELGVFYRLEDGSVWARLSTLGLQDRVVLRSNGTTGYLTQDLATAAEKFEDYRMDRSIYVVGSEQDVHFQNLFAALELLGYPWAQRDERGERPRLHHASYGLVTLPRGMGKLKSREGTAVDADELLDEMTAEARAKIVEGGFAESEADVAVIAEQIGQGALKLFLLQVSAEKNIQFDPRETIAFQGDTGPAVQYSHARIHGILRKGLATEKVREEELTPLGGASGGGASGQRFFRTELVDAALLREPLEREVIRKVADFPGVVATAARTLSPSPVANFLLDLTKAYARMYHEHEVLRASDPALLRARLQLGLVVAQTLRNGLALLTVDAPQRM